MTGLVARSYLGGLAVGAAAAAAAYYLLRSLRDATTINIGLLLVPFVAYLVAELIGASGVLAVVVAGLAVGYASARISTAASRRQTESAWPLGSQLLNGSLFVLIGLEVQVVVRDLGTNEVVRLLGVVVAVWVGLLVVRFAFQTLSISLIRLLDRRPSQRARRMTYRARVVSAVAGFRGAVSLAIALSVPAVLENGNPFPARDQIVFVTTGVIVLTLLVQGPLLPVVVLWARLPEDTGLDDELALAERALTTTTVTTIPELAAEHGISDEVRDRVSRDYAEHLSLMEASRSERRAAASVARTSDAAPAPGTQPVVRRAGWRSPTPHRSPATRSTAGCDWPCSTASARSCSGCAAKAPSTTPLHAASRPGSTSKNCDSPASNPSTDDAPPTRPTTERLCRQEEIPCPAHPRPSSSSEPPAASAAASSPPPSSTASTSGACP